MIVRRPKPLLIILIIIAILLISTACTYLFLTRPVDRHSTKEIEVVIPSGTSTTKISKILKEKELIRSTFLFNVITKLNRDKTLKASTYKLKQSMNLDEIIDVLSEGNHYNEDAVKITFKEGERLTDYALHIAEATSNNYEEVIEVFNNGEYLKTLISKYWFLTEDILQEGIYYPLEGYLAPNTYEFKDKDVKVEEIIEKMLDQEEKELNQVKKQFVKTPHEVLTLASMAELEGTNTKNRKMIVGIFYNRLALGMNLGSDVTTYYALQYPMTSDLTKAQFATDNPYNTRADSMLGKLPIGPICNPSMSSIKASLNPTESDYLYFVADKNKKIYYTKTMEEHQAKVQEIKDKGEWIW